jgi:hypothetical protein
MAILDYVNRFIPIRIIFEPLLGPLKKTPAYRCRMSVTDDGPVVFAVWN